jgi:hypothetical protein
VSLIEEALRRQQELERQRSGQEGAAPPGAGGTPPPMPPVLHPPGPSRNVPPTAAPLAPSEKAARVFLTVVGIVVLCGASAGIAWWMAQPSKPASTQQQQATEPVKTKRSLLGSLLERPVRQAVRSLAVTTSTLATVSSNVARAEAELADADAPPAPPTAPPRQKPAEPVVAVVSRPMPLPVAAAAPPPTEPPRTSAPIASPAQPAPQPAQPQTPPSSTEPASHEVKPTIPLPPPPAPKPAGPWPPVTIKGRVAFGNAFALVLGNGQILEVGDRTASGILLESATHDRVRLVYQSQKRDYRLQAGTFVLLPPEDDEP